MEALGKTCAVVAAAMAVHLIISVALGTAPSMATLAVALAVFSIFKQFENETD